MTARRYKLSTRNPEREAENLSRYFGPVSVSDVENAHRFTVYITIHNPRPKVEGFIVDYRGRDTPLGPAILVGSAGRYYPMRDLLWAKHGSMALPSPADLGEAEEFIKRVELDEEFCCSRCESWKPIEDRSLTHFAGNYCLSCSEEYKKENARRCTLCRQPLYLCSC